MKEQFEARPYWKPEPKLYGVEFWMLFVPASIYTIGVILFGREAIIAGAIKGATQGIGSLLMVIGGEIGTLASANEVFKKHRDGDANILDWFGLLVSLAATLGTLFVVYTKLTPLATAWVQPVREWGPLALLLFSGLDFYANVMELAFFRSHFGDAWAKWNEQRHNDEMRQRNQWQELREPAPKQNELVTVSPELAQPRRIDINEWREIAASLNGQRANLDAKGVNVVLVEHGLEAVPPSTARYWARAVK